MNIQKLYQDLKENKITKNQFLFQIRKDSRINSFFSPLNSFDETVKILKSKQLLFEGAGMKHPKFDELVKKYMNKGYSEENAKKQAASDINAGDRAAGNSEKQAFSGQNESMIDSQEDDYTPPLTMRDAIEAIGSRYNNYGNVEKIKNYLESNRDRMTIDHANDVGGYYGLDGDDLGPATDYLPAGHPDLDDDDFIANKLQEAKQPKKDVDHVNPYEYKKGVYYELELQAKKGHKDVEKAKAIVLKNLNKNSNFYTDMVAGENDSKQEAHEMKEATAGNLVDKLNAMMPVKESLKKLLNDIIG